MLFGGFDLESASAADALTHCKTPVLFIHGGDDRFVPNEMGGKTMTAALPIIRSCS